MAITRAQQFRQMLEDGGMLVKPGNGKRPGYRGDDAARAEKARSGKNTTRAAPPSGTPQGDGPASGGPPSSLPPSYTPPSDDEIRRIFKLKPGQKRGEKYKPTLGDAFSNLSLFKFGQALKDSEFNKRRKQKFLKDILESGKRFQKPRFIKVPFIGDVDTNKNRERVNIIAQLTKGLDLDNLSTDQQNEIYDKVMDARMAGQTDAAGNLAPGFMFDAQGNIISTGNDGRDTEAEQLALLAQATNPNQATTPTEETTPTDPRFYRLLADGGRVGIMNGGRIGFRIGSEAKDKGQDISGREYDAPSTASKSVSSSPSRDDGPESNLADTTTKKQLLDMATTGAKNFAVNQAIKESGIGAKLGKLLSLNPKLAAALGIIGAVKGSRVGDQSMLNEEDIDGLPESNLLAFEPGSIKDKQLKNMYNIFQETGMQDPRMKDLMQEDIKEGGPLSLPEEAYQTAAEGGRIGAMEGGIMDLETGRQMYFLGKLVKKATRAVKKVVKSPIGKAAIGAALFKAGGGFKGLGSLFGTGSLNPLKAEIMDSGTRGIGLSKFGRILSDFGLVDPSTQKLTGLAKILGGGFLTLSPFLFGDDENKDQTIDPSMLGPTIDIAGLLSRPYQASLGQGFVRSAADGGRIGYQEGSKEPVAKKTMPLLDMDGQEMDLRDNGGFVPIGRMEKADDVPARLSKNEFVFTADAVRNAGDGDIDKGAEVMYNMMKNLEDGGNVSEESQGLEGARNMFQTAQRLEEVL